jgi:hypothetical protein
LEQNTLAHTRSADALRDLSDGIKNLPCKKDEKESENHG